MTFTIHKLTHMGDGHAQNEDALGTRVHPNAPTCCLCVLADGQGGRPGGQQAAQVACHAALEAAVSYAPSALQVPKTWMTIAQTCDRAVDASSEAGFTTLVALAITPHGLCGASCGDSAAVLITADRHMRRLTAYQQKHPPVGSGVAQFTPFCTPLQGGESLLMMSDGIWKYVGWNAIAHLVQEHRGQSMLDALQTAARCPDHRSFRDDCTAVLICL